MHITYTQVMFPHINKEKDLVLQIKKDRQVISSLLYRVRESNPYFDSESVVT